VYSEPAGRFQRVKSGRRLLKFGAKINSVEIDIANSIEHELAKFVCVWLIRKGFLANNLPKIYKEWNLACDGELIFSYIPEIIKKYGQKFKRKWQIPQVVTEARFKKIEYVKSTGKTKGADVFDFAPRADIWILDKGAFDTPPNFQGETVEIETNKKIKKKGAIVVYV